MHSDYERDRMGRHNRPPAADPMAPRGDLTSAYRGERSRGPVLAGAVFLVLLAIIILFAILGSNGTDTAPTTAGEDAVIGEPAAGVAPETAGTAPAPAPTDEAAPAPAE